ncbi:MAG: sulfatase [Prosthecobacter sp.]
MKHTFLPLLATLSPFLLSPLRGADAPRPNVVLFLIDDMNVDSIGCFGGDSKLTPNLDRMAAEGVRFANAHVSTTVCTPSRYSFITGRYAGHSHSKLYRGEIGAGQGNPEFNMALEADNKNAAALLQQAGYHTGMVGKVHIFSEVDKPAFYADGAGPVETRRKSLKAGAEADRVFQKNHEWACRYVRSLGFDFAKHIHHGNLEKPYNRHNPEWTMDAALEFLDARKSEPDRPFFLHYCPTLTHGGGRQFADALDQLDITGEGRREPSAAMKSQRQRFQDWLKANAVTDAEAIGTAWVDFQVGVMLEKLRELGREENTLLIFSPDHGRDSKSALYTFNGTQVPMIMRWPRGIPAGRTSQALVQNVDIAPTLFDLAGAAVPADYTLDGRSLLPLFKGGTPAGWREDLYFEIGAARAVLTQSGTKYIALRHTAEDQAEIKRCSLDRLPAELSPTKRLGIGVRAVDQPGFYDEDQLYDLAADPREQKNLATDPAHAAQLKEMQARLLTYLQRVGTPYGDFIPGPGTAAPGQIADAIALARKLEVQGKTVTVPKELAKQHPERTGKPRRKDRRKQEDEK